MKRLMEKIVFLGLVTCWCLAGCPTRISPLSVKATTEGVRRLPWALTKTLGWSPSMMATTLLVVPRSIPIGFAMISLLKAPRCPRREASAGLEQPMCHRSNPPFASQISVSQTFMLDRGQASAALLECQNRLGYTSGCQIGKCRRSPCRREKRGAEKIFLEMQLFRVSAHINEW